MEANKLAQWTWDCLTLASYMVLQGFATSSHLLIWRASHFQATIRKLVSTTSMLMLIQFLAAWNNVLLDLFPECLMSCFPWSELQGIYASTYASAYKLFWPVLKHGPRSLILVQVCESILFKCAMNMAGMMCAQTANQLIVSGLSLSMCVRTRKMVNYAWEK